MSAKNIIYGEDARKKLKEGVGKLSKAVCTSFGPRGGNVALEKSWGTPQVVHDGVTIAKEIELEDKFENLGAQIVKESASKTNDVAGDGTTSAIVLANAIVEEGLNKVDSGTNPMVLRRGLEKATDLLVEEISRISKKISSKEEKIQVATISAQNSEVGKLIADAMEKVGDEGVITVDESKGFNLELEYKEGMQFDKGYLSPYFVTNTEKMESVVENPYILVTDIKISNMQAMLPLLESLMKVSKDLVIVCDDVDGEALATLVVNKLRGILNVLAVKAPGFGDNRKAMLEDIAILTGATFVSEEKGRKLDSVVIEDLGRADRVISDKDNTTIVGGKGDDKSIRERIKMISTQIEKETSDYDKDKLKERLAKLSGGVAVVRVGAATEAELKELKLRVEDAVQATKAAVEEGIVPGGGIAFLRIKEALKDVKYDGDEQVAVDILSKALEVPIRHLIKNTGHDVDTVLKEIDKRSSEEKNKNIGFDVLKMSYTDMVTGGIIDPAKVTRSALQNAVSAATMIITTECLVTDIPKEEEKPSTPNMEDY
ncbi:chaperonin GroEL [candidate division WWE3 bacterium]|uniref:Chaperonin GroEL n=1 Tax=candidate division WWE3 bacterium TaxID=2053526 RepID=A0A7X9E6C5_UNCKA|nr:chaperonin GroEL [candidate division WWE3 bacterium]